MPLSALDVLASLADEKTPAARDDIDVLQRSPEWQWEGVRHLGCFIPEHVRWILLHPDGEPQQGVSALTKWWPAVNLQAVRDKKQAKRMAALDQLRSREQILRLGWLWLTGTPQTGEMAGKSICMPLLNAVVVLESRIGVGRVIQRASDVYTNPRIVDEKLQRTLVNSPEFGGGALSQGMNLALVSRLSKLTSAASTAAMSMGVPIDEWLPPAIDPRSRRRGDGVAAIPGVGLFVDPNARRLSRAQVLTDWRSQSDLQGTAFATIYGTSSSSLKPSPQKVPTPGSVAALHNTLIFHPTRPLDIDQRAIVIAARTEPLLGVVGPPGTGKTHTLCEVALDAIAQGQSVLIGANSDQAVSVLAKQLAEVGGPVPVLFGGSRTGRDLSIQLVDLLTSASSEKRKAAERAASEASDSFEQQADRLSSILDAEQMAARLLRDPAYRLDCEDKFGEITASLPQARAVIRRSGPLGTFGRWRLARRLSLDSGQLPEHLHAADRYLLARSSATGHGVELTGSFEELFLLEDALLAANAKWLAELTLERLSQSRSGRRTINDVSAAVRSSRARRRDLLSQLDGDTLADSAPLWLGTVTDIDDVLPPDPAMFDLVILDESSQMDQLASAGALLRARRAVVCGDPRQLRHVSFVSDAAADEANATRLANGHSRIDVRRHSTLDQAIAAGTGHSLRTHYRSAPHLISFNAKHFYNGALDIATTNPSNDGTDLIDVLHVDGERNEQKINSVEIDSIVSLFGGTGRRTARFKSIGIVSPFRAQADAIVETLIQQFDPGELEKRGIEVGTVHAFQGAEFDLVIASWCLDPESSSRSWAFLNDSNLFNVMVSRARRKLVVVTSVQDPPGLAGQFVRHGEFPPLPVSTGEASGWIGQVQSTLADANYDVASNYQVGRFTVDLVLRCQQHPTAVICQPHRDGPLAHIQRDRLLRRLGWSIHEAFQSRWADDIARFAIELGLDVAGHR